MSLLGRGSGAWLGEPGVPRLEPAAPAPPARDSSAGGCAALAGLLLAGLYFSLAVTFPGSRALCLLGTGATFPAAVRLSRGNRCLSHVGAVRQPEPREVGRQVPLAAESHWLLQGCSPLSLPQPCPWTLRAAEPGDPNDWGKKSPVRHTLVSSTWRCCGLVMTPPPLIELGQGF